MHVTKVVLRFGISSLASIHQPGDCVHLMWKIGRHGLEAGNKARPFDARRFLGIWGNICPCGNNWGTTNVECVQRRTKLMHAETQELTNYTGPTDVRQAALSGHWGTYNRATPTCYLHPMADDDDRATLVLLLGRERGPEPEPAPERWRPPRGVLYRAIRGTHRGEFVSRAAREVIGPGGCRAAMDNAHGAA